MVQENQHRLCPMPVKELAEDLVEQVSLVVLQIGRRDSLSPFLQLNCQYQETYGVIFPPIFIYSFSTLKFYIRNIIVYIFDINGRILNIKVHIFTIKVENFVF